MKPFTFWRPVLVLDFDTYEQYREFPMRARMLARWLDMRLVSFRIKRHRTAKGWHVVVYQYYTLMREYSPLEIVCAQSLLGSDWKREIFNFIRSYHIADAPPAWQRIGRWNTTYSRKMGVIDEGMRESGAARTSTNPDVENER